MNRRWKPEIKRDNKPVSVFYFKSKISAVRYLRAYWFRSTIRSSYRLNLTKVKK